MTVRGGEAFLLKTTIPPYQPNNITTSYDPIRNRKLLLTKKEIAKLGSIERQRGLTIIPSRFFEKGRKIKLEIAVVRGKKKYDKRETMKKEQAKRDVDRSLKGR